jgi:type I restriction enzyme S subunit
MLKCKELDRYFWFHADASVRDGMSWSDFCDVEVTVPDLSTQQKYVDIYKAMVANQQCYERGLEDLKLVCDAYIENISADEYKSIGLFIKRNQNRNQEKVFNKTQVKGFNNEGEFIKPMRLFSGDISTFKVIKKNDFVYNSRINSTIKKLSVALNEGDDLIVSPAYESFYICDTDKLDPYYLYMLLQREQFAKKVLFHSFGSSTLVFGFDNLGEVEIPMPDIQIQRAIANIYRTYKERKAINEKLKTQIKDICPILIRGSLEEGE